MISFFVNGVPIPQGSMRAFSVGGKARMKSDNKRTNPWRADVGAVAARVMDGAPPLTGPVRVRVVFALPRPASVPKDRRGMPSVEPDLDKLGRAILDALTGVVYRDDGQVVQLLTGKHYVGDSALEHEASVPGAAITCEALPCSHDGGADRRHRCRDCGEVMP